MRRLFRFIRQNATSIAQYLKKVVNKTRTTRFFIRQQIYVILTNDFIRQKKVKCAKVEQESLNITIGCFFLRVITDKTAQKQVRKILYLSYK